MKKILFLSNHFIALYKFRKELIIELLNKGYDVYLAIPDSKENSYFSDLGCKITNVTIDRRGVNPISDIFLIIEYIKIFKRIKPDFILSFTIKPNIYGSIAARITKNKQICNITGTGATFLNKNILSFFVRMLYKISITKTYKIFFQNEDDLNYFEKNKMVNQFYELIPGSGVNLDEYNFKPITNYNDFSFLFLGRIMRLKGIDDFLTAAKKIKSQNPNITFNVAGFIEEAKYEKTLEIYAKEGIINYFGYQDDIQKMFSISNFLILPSHGGEGVPNVVLEALATGRICLVSNVSGAKDVIIEGYNGFLFEPENIKDLISQINKIINLKDVEINVLLHNGRKTVEEKFDRKIIINKYLFIIENEDEL
jgi:glycosyltransferase involved in cell wall biosynthesis